MSEYRDFVGVGEEILPDAYDNRRAYVDTTIKGQVYMATHKGEEYLPFMNRSFISFSFGGKNIEDFNLIATTENNRISRNGSSEFEDLVDQYNILDGQFYWGTHFKPNKITFKLATDGMTQQDLDSFLYWFAGGKTRELILAEHPNRAILARIGSPPALTLLPFEKPTTVLVGGLTYNTSTTLYKGEITLDFVMDSPFWYSKINIFGQCDEEGVYHDTWVDANGQIINIYDVYKNIDVMKIVLEDNIPTSTMIANSMLLGNNVFANIDDTSGGHIAKYTTYVQIDKITYADGDLNNVSGIQAQIGYLLLGIPDELHLYLLDDQLNDIPSEDKTVLIEALVANGLSVTIESTVTQLQEAITTLFNTKQIETLTRSVDDDDPNALIYNPETHVGAHIAGPHMDKDTGVESLPQDSSTNFYYSGTTYALPTISFAIQPTVNGLGYINVPANSYAPNRFNNTYDYIKITSLTEQEFRFTTPNLFTSYNEAVKILREVSDKVGESWEIIRTLIRDNVKHFAVRAWAMKIIDFYVLKNDSKIIGNQNVFALMSQFLYDTNGEIPKVNFEFNSSTGESIGTFQYRTMTDTEFNFDSNLTDVQQFLSATNSFDSVQEDVGDMVKSKYLIIKDRNHPDETGHIIAWSPTNDFTKTYSHKLEHSIRNGIYNLFIKYKNMYL